MVDVPPPPIALTAPTGVMATGGDGTIDVSWNVVEGADSYNVNWHVADSGVSQNAHRRGC
jgi:hypothetical protein